MDINALRQKAKDLANRGKEILQRNGGQPTAEDITEHRNIMEEARGIGAQIEAAVAQRNLETLFEGGQAPVTEPPEPDRSNRSLSNWARSASRAIVAAGGGIFVPDQFIPQLFGYKPEEELILPGATIVPGNPEQPDAAVEFPSLDQAGGAFAGLTVTWISEGDPKPDTDMDFTPIRFEPNEVAATVDITDKLLRNAPMIQRYLEEFAPKALRADRDRQFIGAAGGGVPLGINNIGNPALLSIPRAGGGAIAWADVLAMLQALAPESVGNAIWIASQSALTSLATLQDANNNAIWLPGDIVRGIPATLYGIPIRFTGKLPVLGNAGDLMLVDRSFYGVRLGTNITIDYSKHVLFRSNKTVMKIYHTADGQPLVTSPLLLEDGVTTVSPFVRLAA